MTPALWRDSRSSTAAGGSAAASSMRSSPSSPSSNAGGARRLQGFGRAHSRPLQRDCFHFPTRIGAGDLRPHRPQRSRRWISMGWRGRSRPVRRPLSSASIGDRPQAMLPRSHWPDWISAAECGRCGRCGRSRPSDFWRGGSAVVVMRIVRVRARPSRSKPISMPILRRKVAARRSRPAVPGAIWPGLGLGDALARHLGKGAQKIRGGSRPLRPLGHHGAHGGGDRIGVDHALDRLVAIAAIGRPEGAGGPQRGLAGRRP